jgi:hypothetical protein
MRLLTEDFHVRRNIHEFGGGEPVLDGVVIDRGYIANTTGSFSPFTGVTTSDVSGLSASVSGLTANTNYYF